MKIKVIGQDPSMNNWGLVAATVDLDRECAIEILDMQVIIKPKDEKLTKKQVRKSHIDLVRARALHTSVQGFITNYAPHFTMIEVPHGSQSATAMKAYGICLGILGSVKTPMIELTEQECKLHAHNRKSATKAESIEYAMSRYPNAPWKYRTLKGRKVSVDGYNEHIADAVIAIEAGLYTDQFINAAAFAQQFGT
jgi:hypothetical protein